MNSTNKILLGLVAVQALLFVGTSVGREDRMQVRSALVLEGLDADDVTRVEIYGPPGDEQESIVLARTGNQWGIEDADGYPAKRESVEALLGKLAKMRSTTTVVTSAKYHEKLKVTDDDYVRRLRVTADGDPVELLIGTSPSFKNTHVRVGGSDDVFLVNDLSTSDVTERAWNWVDRKYVDIPADEVWSVTIDNEDGTMRLERDPASDTWAAVGVEGPVKKTALDELVRKARTLNLEAPVGKAEAPEYGLASPSATVRLVVGTSTIAGAPPPETQERAFRVGAKVDGQSRYYAKADDSDYVVEVAEYAVKPLLEKSAADLLETSDDE